MRKILVLLIAIVSLSACSGVKDLRVGGYKIADLTTEGLSSVSGTVILTVSNPGKELILREIVAEIRNGDSHFADFTTTAPSLIPGNSVSECPVSGKLALAPGVSAMSLLFGGMDKDNIRMDVTMKFEKSSGAVKKYRFRNVTWDQISQMMPR